MQVCLTLEQELKRKESRTLLLIRENNELKSELSSMVDQVKSIVAKMGLKAEEKTI